MAMPDRKYAKKVDETTGGILNGIPPGTSAYGYQGLDHYRRIVDHENDLFSNDQTRTRSQFVIFTNVTEDNYLNEIWASNDNNITVPIDSYDPVRQILVLTITTATHMQASQVFSQYLTAKLHSMNLSPQFLSLEAIEVETPYRRKRPDQSGRPVTLPPGRSSTWPSIVVECGCPQSRAKFESDIRWWLMASYGDVKTALTIEYDKGGRQITIEKWILADLDPGMNPTKKVLSAIQRVVVSEDDQKTSRVSNAPLTIAFEDLFLRPARGLDEGDIVFVVEDFRNLAEKIWTV